MEWSFTMSNNSPPSPPLGHEIGTPVYHDAVVVISVVVVGKEEIKQALNAMIFHPFR